MANRLPLLSRRFRLLVLVALLVIGTLLLYLLLNPRTMTDIGPLDLPGVPPAPAEGDEVLLAVGDIGFCGHQADDRVAELAADLPGTIALLGDTVYPTGTAANYRDCLEPGWGALRDRIRAAVGNHDYVDGEASAYFEWFGAAAGPAGEGWYSYDLGEWHVVVLNSMCAEVGCGPGSAEMEWLQEDLAANAGDCLLAYWHHPRLSSGRHGPVEAVQPLWQAVVDAGVDVTLHGHDHTYERLEVDGVQSFVVGTGGRSLYRWERDPLPETEARHNGTYGLLYLVLRESSFAWEFLPVGKTVFTDSGEGAC